MGNYLTPAVVWIVTIITALGTALALFHHAAVKNEDNKIQVQTDKVIQHIQEKKNEVRNAPRSDNYTIKRLLAGSF